MNPALMDLYLSRINLGSQQEQDPWEAIRNTEVPVEPTKTGWQQRMQHMQNQRTIPGTSGAMQAPEIPDPRPIYQQLGITPDPDTAVGGINEYDTAPQVSMAEATRMEAQRNPGSRGGASFPASPIDRGVQSAIQARRASYDIDDQQRQQAMGLAIMKMSQNYAGSKNLSNLGAINESFGPAMDTFISERDKFQNLNKEAAKEARVAEKDRLDRDIKLQNLAIRRQNGGLSPTEGRLVDKYETDLDKEYRKLETDKEKELNNYIKNQLKEKWGPEKDALIERKRADLDRKYQFSKNNLEKKMVARGLEIANKVEARETAEAVTETTPPVKAPAVKAPKTANGKYDFSNLTDEQLGI